MNKFLDYNCHATRFTVNLGKCIQPTLNEHNEIIYTIDLGKIKSLYPNLDTIKLSTARRGQLAACYMMNKIHQDGVKVFQFNNLDFEALENIDINIELEDYEQPFETIVIMLPNDYAKEKGFLPQLNIIPLFVALNLTIVNGIKTLVIMYGMNDDDNTTVISTNQPGIIEEIFKKTDAQGYCETLERSFNNQEVLIINQILKTAMNAALIADEVGVKVIGEKKKKRKKKENNKEGEIIYYEFAQKVELFSVVKESKKENEREGGWSVKPHWRRGHWKMQPYGTGRKERKRIRIKPILVRKDLFGSSDLGTAKTEYTYNKENDNGTS